MSSGMLAASARNAQISGNSRKYKPQHSLKLQNGLILSLRDYSNLIARRENIHIPQKANAKPRKI
jgi:hypothetical protein